MHIQHIGSRLKPGAGVLALVVGQTLSAAPSAPTALVEDFARDPLAAGWRTVGDASLFSWNPADHNLEVTWDSSRPNSYFVRPLGHTLHRGSDFLLEFDLRLRELRIGTTPGKPYTFQLAVGLMNLDQATAGAFLRGTGSDSPNLVEFDYFADSGFGATISPTIISSNGIFATSFNVPFELTLEDGFRVTLSYRAETQQLTTSLTRQGEPFGPIQPVALGAEFTDFAVDHVAVMSYSDAGQDPQFSGSIFARGILDNVIVAVARPATLDLGLTGRWVEDRWEVQFDARPEWAYTLYRTADFRAMTVVKTLSVGHAGRVTLADPEPAAGLAQFYWLEASRP
ncbi:MAG: hypothetical protein FJ387_24660 [Verrucomicrobia bacterium]|nr:hypothetical protein [Verrucomicrobiota bacterium]